MITKLNCYYTCENKFRLPLQKGRYNIGTFTPMVANWIRKIIQVFFGWEVILKNRGSMKRHYVTRYFNNVPKKVLAKRSYYPYGLPSKYASHRAVYVIIGKEVKETVGNFLNDTEKMRDFEVMTKDEFLQSYSYLSEKEYDNTKSLYIKNYSFNKKEVAK